MATLKRTRDGRLVARTELLSERMNVLEYGNTSNMCILSRLAANPLSMKGLLNFCLNLVLRTQYSKVMELGVDYYFRLGVKLEDPFLISLAMITILAKETVVYRTLGTQMHRRAREAARDYYFFMLTQLWSSPFRLENVQEIASDWLKGVQTPFLTGRYEIVEHRRHPDHDTLVARGHIQNVGLEEGLYDDLDSDPEETGDEEPAAPPELAAGFEWVPPLERPSPETVAARGITIDWIRSHPEEARRKVDPVLFCQLENLGYHQRVSQLTNEAAQKKTAKKRLGRLKLHEEMASAPARPAASSERKRKRAVIPRPKYQYSEAAPVSASPAEQTVPTPPFAAQPLSRSEQFVQQLLQEEEDD